MKPDGSHRTILNLKNLNESITYAHFKMEFLKHVRQLTKPGVWMGSIDLRDAYYVNPPFQQYLAAIGRCATMSFYVCLMGMLRHHSFNKLLKQPFGFLRKHGYASVVYIDDYYLQGDTYAQCLENIHGYLKFTCFLGVLYQW